MPLFDFVQLHHTICYTSKYNIKVLKQELDINSFTELLQIYCKYFFNESNRNKYENNKNHSNIMAKLKKLKKLKSKVGKDKSSSSIITKLPSLLMSYIASFLNNKSRVKMSLINHSFYNIANQSIAKHHLLINEQFILSKLIKTEGDGFQLDNYNKFSAITLTKNSCNFGTPYIKKNQKINFAINIKNLLHSKYIRWINIPRGRRLHMHPIAAPILESLSNNTHISSVKVPTSAYPSTNNNLKHVKSLYVSTSWYMSGHIQSLWVQKQPLDIIDISLGDVAVDKYLVDHNNLEYLDLPTWVTSLTEVKCDNTITPHPIFWLWNIPNLKECNLSITLPKSDLFKIECDKLLASSIIINKIKNQVKFNKLSLNIAVKDYTPTQIAAERIRTDHDNEEDLFAHDMTTFLKNIKKIYPNLTCITYSYFRLTLTSNVRVIPQYNWNLDWNDIFFNIKQLTIDVVSMDASCGLLLSLISNKELTVCHLNEIIPKLSVIHIPQQRHDMYLYINQSINSFIDNLCSFIENRPQSLYSLSIKLKNIHHVGHYNLTKTYWNPYKKYLKRLLNIIDDDVKIFDGYLNLYIPEIWRIFMPSVSQRNWFDGAHEWTKENILCSLEITQLITRIQTKIHEYNKKNPNNEKKTILDLNKLVLNPQHIKFLKFWFKDDLNLFENNKFVMY